MNGFKELAETYANCATLVGKPTPRTMYGGKVKYCTLMPPYHGTKNTDIGVILDVSGNFLRVDDTPMKDVVIPSTEAAPVRSSGVAPYPLHEEVGYLDPDGWKYLTDKAKEEGKQPKDRGKYDAYVLQLSGWCGSDKKLNAVLSYVKSGTLVSDLKAHGVSFTAKTFVRFSVVEQDGTQVNLWEDIGISNKWQVHCAATQGEVGLCYITGKELPIRTSHPKRIIKSEPNAKIISANDSNGFTYRGERFVESKDAVTVSDKASQEGHAMLAYLIDMYGYSCGHQRIVAWRVNDGEKLLNPLGGTDELVRSLTSGSDTTDEQGEELDLSGDMDSEVVTEQDEQIAGAIALGKDYAEAFKSALLGEGCADKLLGGYGKVCVGAYEAVSKGGIAVKFFSCLTENEYAEKLVKWHSESSWNFGYGKWLSTKAPSVDRFIAAIFGEPKPKDKSYAKIKKGAREQFLRCMLEGQPVNASMVISAVKRASKPDSFKNADGVWSEWKWQNAISTACALARKYYTDKGEVITLKLDRECTNRSYLFGRLLAIADRLESYALWERSKSNGDKGPDRATNATRYFNRFSLRPFDTWKQLRSSELTAYVKRLKGAKWYEDEITEVMSLFEDGDFEDNNPLDGRYLMGYYMQRAEYAGSENNNKVNEQEENSNA